MLLLFPDMSWKVRKAAAKIIGSILKNRPEMLEELYETAIPALISRLKSEREEHVMVLYTDPATFV
jgi:cullin-associated NEDD8-dissociated protein 1